MLTCLFCWDPPTLCLPTTPFVKATYLRVRFHFGKGGTVNIQERTFRCFPVERSSFSPLLVALLALDRWTSCDLNNLTPIFCYRKMKVFTFIHDSVVTKNLHEATLQAYPNPHHFYNLHLKYVRTHSVQVIACLILVVEKLSYATIEHILRWASSPCKVYVHGILSHVSKASTSSFCTALGT